MTVTVANHQRFLDQVPDRPLVDGEWVSGSGTTFGVHNPATGEPLARIHSASAEDGTAALDAAVAAAPAWAATPARQRSELLRGAWEMLRLRREEFAQLMTLEMGKPVAEARGEVAYGAGFLCWFAEEAVHIRGHCGSTPEGAGTMIVAPILVADQT